jgi:hypothetical protein
MLGTWTPFNSNNGENQHLVSGGSNWPGRGRREERRGERRLRDFLGVDTSTSSSARFTYNNMENGDPTGWRSVASFSIRDFINFTNASIVLAASSTRPEINGSA